MKRTNYLGLALIMGLCSACKLPPENVGDQAEQVPQEKQNNVLIDDAKVAILGFKAELAKKVAVLKDKLNKLSSYKTSLDAIPVFDLDKPLASDVSEKFAKLKENLAKLDAEIGAGDFASLLAEAEGLLQKAKEQQAKVKDNVGENEEINALIVEIKNMVDAAKADEAKIEAVKNASIDRSAEVLKYGVDAEENIKKFDPSQLKQKYKDLEIARKNAFNLKDLEVNVFNKSAVEITEIKSNVITKKFSDIADEIIDPTHADSAPRGIVGNAKAQHKLIQDQLDIITNGAVASAALTDAAKVLDGLLQNGAKEYENIAIDTTVIEELAAKLAAAKNVLEVKKYGSVTKSDSKTLLAAVKSGIGTANTTKKITDEIDKLADVIIGTKITAFKGAVTTAEGSAVTSERTKIKDAVEKFSVAGLKSLLTTGVANEAEFDLALATLKSHLATQFQEAVKGAVEKKVSNRIKELQKASKAKTKLVATAIADVLSKSGDKDKFQSAIKVDLSTKLKTGMNRFNAWKAGTGSVDPEQARKNFVTNELKTYLDAVTALATVKNQEEAINQITIINSILKSEITPPAKIGTPYTLGNLADEVESVLKKSVSVDSVNTKFDTVMSLFFNAASGATDLAALELLDTSATTDIAKVLSGSALTIIAAAKTAAVSEVLKALRAAAMSLTGLGELDAALGTVQATSKVASAYAVDVTVFANDFLTGDIKTDLTTDVGAAVRMEKTDAQKGVAIAIEVKNHSTWTTLEEIVKFSDAKNVGIAKSLNGVGLSLEELSDATGKLNASIRGAVFPIDGSEAKVVKEFKGLKEDVRLALVDLIAHPVAGKTPENTDPVERAFMLHFERALNGLNDITWTATGDWKSRSGDITRLIGTINKEDATRFEKMFGAIEATQVGSNGKPTVTEREAHKLVVALQLKVKGLIADNTPTESSEFKTISAEVKKLKGYLDGFLK